MLANCSSRPVGLRGAFEIKNLAHVIPAKAGICYVSIINMIFVVGLGNPGEEYKETRHNVGRIVLEALRKRFEGEEWMENKKIKAVTTEIVVGKKKVMLVEPETYMNKSGLTVGALIKNKKALDELIVVYDDLDLPLGRMKISFNRSSGGHRGLESIIKAVKSEAFLRIRVGISPSTSSGKMKKPLGEEAVDKHIMGKFKSEHLDELKKLSRKIGDAIEIFVEEGKDKMMTVGNAQ